MTNPPRVALRMLTTIVALAATASCSSTTDEATGSSKWALRGIYDAKGAGAIEQLTFYDEENYFLVKSGCADDAKDACFEFGTYTLDARDVLTLAPESGEPRSLPLGGLAAGTSPKALRPLDGDLTTGEGRDLTSGSSTLTTSTGRPIATDVEAAGQPLVRTGMPLLFQDPHVPVQICGHEEENEGCAPCSLPAKLGSVDITDQERSACTLVALRPWLRNHIRNLLVRAGSGRNRMFLPVTDNGQSDRARVTLRRIIVGGSAPHNKNINLRGSFVTGQDAEPVANAGVTVTSVSADVKYTIEFQDNVTGDQLAGGEAMALTYHIIPFFHFEANAGITLNPGKILSTFGGGALASTLIGALGGEMSVRVEGSVAHWWAGPVCADSATPAARGPRPPRGQSADHETFDRDFYRSVLAPFCEQVRDTNGYTTAQLPCQPPDGSPLQTKIEGLRKALGGHAILPVRRCAKGTNSAVRRDDFVFDIAAPESWGLDRNDEAFLYEQDPTAPTLWEKIGRVRILNPTGDCGTLAAGETCVQAHFTPSAYASLLNRFDATCTAVGARTTRLGIAQGDGAARIGDSFPPAADD